MAQVRPPTPEELERWEKERAAQKQAIFDAHTIIDDRYPPPPQAVPCPAGSVPIPTSRPPGNIVGAKRQYGDADDFYRQTTGNDPLFLEDITGSDSYFLHNTVSGNLYKLTGTQVMQGGMGRFRMGELFTLNQIDMNRVNSPTTATYITTHVMHKGSVLCKNVSGSPVNWPKNHEWVPLDVQTEKEVCNCLGCIEVWRKLR